MEVKIKKLHEDAVIPTYANKGDAGMDLTAVSFEVDNYGNAVYHTGLAFEIPEGYVGLIFPRSSICKKDLSLANAVAVIDSGFRGEVVIKFKSTIRSLNPITAIKNIIRHRIFKKGGKWDIVYNFWDKKYKENERIAQMIILPYPRIELKESDILSETERGEGGFGSSGK